MYEVLECYLFRRLSWWTPYSLVRPLRDAHERDSLPNLPPCSFPYSISFQGKHSEAPIRCRFCLKRYKPDDVIRSWSDPVCPDPERASFNHKWITTNNPLVDYLKATVQNFWLSKTNGDLSKLSTPLLNSNKANLEAYLRSKQAEIFDKYGTLFRLEFGYSGERKTAEATKQPSN